MEIIKDAKDSGILESTFYKSYVKKTIIYLSKREGNVNEKFGLFEAFSMVSCVRIDLLPKYVQKEVRELEDKISSNKTLVKDLWYNIIKNDGEPWNDVVFISAYENWYNLAYKYIQRTKPRPDKVPIPISGDLDNVAEQVKDDAKEEVRAEIEAEMDEVKKTKARKKRNKKKSGF